MSVRKCTIAITMAVGMLLGMSACKDSGTETATALVQGNLDEIYLGEFSEEYMDMVEITLEEAQQTYLEGIEVEAEYFANYWGIVAADYGEVYADLNEDLKQDIQDLYKEIYSYSKYEVQEAVKQDDSTYSVKVNIQPIDVMERAVELYENDAYAPLNAFWEKYATVDFSTMTDDDYVVYTHEYGAIIVQLVREQIPALGYKEEKSMVIQVEDIDDVIQMNGDDLATFDSYVIYYP